MKMIKQLLDEGALEMADIFGFCGLMALVIAGFCIMPW